ncbi:MAG: hypothetical protein K8T20_05885 [Planctomycetes bacterium]|nr:hypothetical protein [Planctomycetota bacterium]
MRRFNLLLLVASLGCSVRPAPVEDGRWNVSGVAPNDPPAFSMRSVAGNYDTHSPGGGAELRIGTDGRWTYHDFSFFGTSNDMSSGTFRVSGDSIVLEENDAIGFPSGEYVVLTLVRWCERRYLLAPDDFARFCNHLNWGSEPERSMWGRFLLKDEGAERFNIVHPVEGPPGLPAEWLKHILREPIAGVVREVLPEGRLRVDLGSAEGIFPEMDLRAVDERGVNLTFLRAVSCTEHECVLEPRGKPEGQTPQVGWKVTCDAKGAEFAPK